MGSYILALDQGTTSSRVILFDREQNILGISQREFTQIYPQEGWVEHDAMEIWSSQYSVMMEVIAQSGIDPADIAGIGITNQRETTILWDRETGRPICNAIVWQCRRTAGIVDQLLADGYGEHIRETTGLGAPYWDMYARGAILGITRGTKREHIIRAAQESIAYQVADLVQAMEADTGMPLNWLKADGGASRDRFLMQFQADILAKEVRRPAIRETTALGAAYLAGLATGVWKDQEEIKRLWMCETTFAPDMEQARREKLVSDWHKAVGRSRGWAK